MGNTKAPSKLCKQLKDHPHIHGEYWKIQKQQIYQIGSPPHTWGIPTGPRLPISCLRITPTYMGNTFLIHLYSLLPGDHPHIHGEYLSSLFTRCSHAGSPPHTWGILTSARTRTAVSRITPTYMGNTDCYDVNIHHGEDHPHIHGEYFQELHIPFDKSGSPPHTWGIRH